MVRFKKDFDWEQIVKDNEAPEEIIYVSKSEIKRDADTYREIAQTLVNLKRSRLKVLDLDLAIKREIVAAQNTKNMEARRRQINFVSKLLRSLDLDELKERMSNLLVSSFTNNKSKLDKQVRVTVDRLLNPEHTQSTFASLERQFPDFNKEFVQSQLSLITNTKASQFSSSELYQYFHSLLLSRYKD